MTEEHRLIELLNRSDKEAFAALYDLYADMVYNFAASVTKDASLAQDITQNCFIQLWNHRKEISPDGNLPAWLYVTARNAVYKEARRKLTQRKFEEAAVGTGSLYEAASHGNSDYYLIREEVRETVDALPESRRKIYRMKNAEGKNVKQIAEELGISQKTVETQLSRADKAIRKRISRLFRS